jgi:hypothetical protein
MPLRDPSFSYVPEPTVRALRELRQGVQNELNSYYYTKAEIDSLLAAICPVGTVAMMPRTTAPPGWLKLDGKTIGDASSGATARANADTMALFCHLWDTFGNDILPIQNSDGSAGLRGASAAADFAAHKRMPLFDDRGEFWRCFDDGRNVDPGRTLGSTQSEMVGPHNHAIGLGWNDSSSNFYGLDEVNNLGTQNTDNNTGTETRPRNRAYLAVIKY